MGDRSRIIVESESFIQPIHLYGHWSGNDNLMAVVNVLSRTDRIGDPSYLTAQLFYEFSNLGNYDGNLSFGIGVAENIGEMFDDNDSITVFADTGYVVYQNLTFSKQEFLDAVWAR